jgi:hypothetical protein
MKVKIKKDRVQNIALMSLPAAMILPVSLPLAIAAAILSGSVLGTDSDDEYEINVSFSQWTKIIQEQHLAEEEKKRLATLYWRYKGHSDT